MLPEAAKALLGLSRRSGTVALGSAAATDAVQRRTAHLVMVAEDAGGATKRRFAHLCQLASTPICRIGTSVELGAALGTDPKAVCAITSEEMMRGLWQVLSDAGVVMSPPQGGAGIRPATPGSSRP